MNNQQVLNMMYNEEYMLDILTIEDTYFRDKLLQGLIKYEPMEWEQFTLKPMEERSLDAGYDLEEGR